MPDLTLDLYLLLWRALRPLLFLHSPQRAHERALSLLSWMDRSETAISLASRMHRSCFPRSDSPSAEVGGVRFAQPLILAAGMVKGPGFETEQDALAAVERGDDLLPGWRSLPALLGPVEFGSFTRWPRVGNHWHRTTARFCGARRTIAWDCVTRGPAPLPAFLGYDVANCRNPGE